MENILSLNLSVGQTGVNRPDDVHEVESRLQELGFDQTITRPESETVNEGTPQTGFFNRELVIEITDDHDWGSNWLGELIIAAGKKYRDNYLWKDGNANRFKSLITLNDFSVPLGGASPDHAGHQTGTTFDMVLPWKDGTARRPGIYSSDKRFDTEALQEMLKAFKEAAADNPNGPQIDRMLFSGPKSIHQAIGDQLLKKNSHHKDHVDLKINAPEIVRGTQPALAAEVDVTKPAAEFIEAAEPVKEARKKVVERFVELGFAFAGLDSWENAPAQPQLHVFEEGKRARNRKKYQITNAGFSPLEWAVRLFDAIVFDRATVQIPLDAWDETKAYEIGDRVHQDEISYQALKKIELPQGGETHSAPATDSKVWAACGKYAEVDLILQKGSGNQQSPNLFDWLFAENAPHWTRMPAGTIEQDEKLIRGIKIFQAMIGGRPSVIGSDGRVDVNLFTHRWLNALNAPQWTDLESAGEGFEIVPFPDDPVNHSNQRKISNWLLEFLHDAGSKLEAASPGLKLQLQHPGAAQFKSKAPLSGLRIQVLLPTQDGTADTDLEKTAKFTDAIKAADPSEKINTLWFDPRFSDEIVTVPAEINAKKGGQSTYGYLELRLEPPARELKEESQGKNRRVIFLGPPVMINQGDITSSLTALEEYAQAPRIGLVTGTSNNEATTVFGVLFQFVRPFPDIKEDVLNDDDVSWKTHRSAIYVPLENQEELNAEEQEVLLSDLLDEDQGEHASFVLPDENHEQAFETFVTSMPDGKSFTRSYSINAKSFSAGALPTGSLDLGSLPAIRLTKSELEFKDYVCHKQGDDFTVDDQGFCIYKTTIANRILPQPYSLNLNFNSASDQVDQLNFSAFENPDRPARAETIPMNEGDTEQETTETDDFPVTLVNAISGLEGYKVSIPLKQDRLLQLPFLKINTELKLELLLCPQPGAWLVSAGFRGELGGGLNLDLGSSLVKLKSSIKAECFFGLHGFELALVEFTGVTLSLDLFDKLKITDDKHVVMNNIWGGEGQLLELQLVDPLNNSELDKYRLSWTGGGMLRVNTQFFKRLFQERAGKIPNLLEVDSKRVLESLKADIPGADGTMEFSFNKPSNDVIELATNEKEYQIKVNIGVKVTDKQKNETVLEGNGSITLAVDHQNGLIEFHPGAFSCSGESEITVGQKNGMHHKFADLISLHVPHGSRFKFELKPSQPAFAWLPPVQKGNQDNARLSLRIPASDAKSDAELHKNDTSSKNKSFAFDLESFALKSSGLDMKGAVKTHAFKFFDTQEKSEQKTVIFQDSLASKPVRKDPSAGKSQGNSAGEEPPKIGEIQFRHSRLVAGSLELTGKLPYFDNATGTLGVTVSEDTQSDNRSLRCLGTFDIAGLKEFYLADLYARCHIKSLSLTTEYTTKGSGWNSQGHITGKVIFAPPAGKSASDMGPIANLFSGVTVAFEKMSLNKIGLETITITTPPKQFTIADVLKVDLRGLEINDGKNFGLLGDITIQKLPGVDASLTFGGISLKQKKKGGAPDFTIKRIAGQISTPGGFKMHGALEHLKNDVEVGFAGGFQFKTDVIPGVSGIVKLTRIKARNGAWVPSLAIFMETDFEAALFAGFFLREVGAGVGLRQALRGLQPQPGTTLPQRIMKFVDNPKGLPAPREISSWQPVQPDKPSSRMTWMLVGAGLITYGKLERNKPHTFAGSLMLSIDQDLEIVLAANAWLFTSPEETRRPEFVQRPVVRGAIGLSIREKRLFAYFRTIRNPRLGKDAPKLLVDILGRLQTSLMISADRHGFLLEVGWPWETRLGYSFGKYLTGALVAGFRFGLYRGVLTFGLNYAIEMRLEASKSLKAGPARASLTANGSGYFRTQFLGAIDSRLNTYLLGDVRIAATINLSARLEWSISFKVFGKRYSKTFHAGASFNISISAALTAAMDSNPAIGFRGEAAISVSVRSFRIRGNIAFGFNESLIDDVRRHLDRLAPPRVFGQLDSRSDAVLTRSRDVWQYHFCPLKVDNSSDDAESGKQKVIRVLLYPAPGLIYPKVATTDNGELPPHRFEIPLTNLGKTNFRGIVGLETAPEDLLDGQTLRWSEQLDQVLIGEQELRKVFPGEDESKYKDPNNFRTLKDLIGEMSSPENAQPAETLDVEAEEIAKGRLAGHEVSDARVRTARRIEGDDESAGISEKVRSPNLSSDSEYDRELVEASRDLAPLARTKVSVIESFLEKTLSTDDAVAAQGRDDLTQHIQNLFSDSQNDWKITAVEEMVLPERTDVVRSLFLESNQTNYILYETGKTSGNEDNLIEIWEADVAGNIFDPALVFGELLKFMHDPQAHASVMWDPAEDAGREKATYEFAPYMGLILEFDAEEIVTSKPEDPINRLIDFDKLKQDHELPPEERQYQLGGDNSRLLESVLGPGFQSRLPEYDLVAGNQFQSKNQICLTWEFLREDPIEMTTSTDGPTDPWSVYVELEKYIIIRENLSATEQAPHTSTLYPSWIENENKNNLIQPQFQFVDQELKGIEEGNILLYRIEAHAPDRLLASTLIQVQRQTIERLKSIAQPLALQQFELTADRKHVATYHYSLIVPFDADDNDGKQVQSFEDLMSQLKNLLNVTDETDSQQSLWQYWKQRISQLSAETPSDSSVQPDSALQSLIRDAQLELAAQIEFLQQLKLRYRFVTASTVGAYGFGEVPITENEWVDPTPVRTQKQSGSESFPDVRFAESPQARPLPWNDTFNLPFNLQGNEGSIAVELKPIQGFHPDDNRSDPHVIGFRFRIQLSDSQIQAKWKPWQALELYIGLEQRASAGASLHRSSLIKCRHAVWMKPVVFRDQQLLNQQLESILVTRNQQLNLDLGNQVDAFELIPEDLQVPPEMAMFVETNHVADTNRQRELSLLPESMVSPNAEYTMTIKADKNDVPSDSSTDTGDGSDNQHDDLTETFNAPTLVVEWQHDKRGRIGIDGTTNFNQSQFNPAIGYRVHYFDRFDPRNYDRNGFLHVTRTAQEAIAVLPERMYRAVPASIEPKGLPIPSKSQLKEQGIKHSDLTSEEKELPQEPLHIDWMPQGEVQQQQVGAAPLTEFPWCIVTPEGNIIQTGSEPSARKTRISYPAAPIYLDHRLINAITAILTDSEFEVRYPLARCVLSFVDPLTLKNEDRSLWDHNENGNPEPEPVCAARATHVLESINQLSDVFNQVNDPYGWLSTEYIGMSCECHFLDQTEQPIPTEQIIDTFQRIELKSAESSNQSQPLKPVTLFNFLAEDERTPLNVIRLVVTAKDIVTAGESVQKQTLIGLILHALGKPYDISSGTTEGLVGTKPFQEIAETALWEFSPSEDPGGIDNTIAKQIAHLARRIKSSLPDWGKPLEINSRIVSAGISTLVSKEQSDTHVVTLANNTEPYLKSSKLPQGDTRAQPANPTGREKQVALASRTLPISGSGTIRHRIPLPDRWSHHYHIAIEPVRRYDRLWQVLEVQPVGAAEELSILHSEIRPIKRDHLQSHWARILIDRTEPLAPQGLIATPLPGSVQAIVLRHPASFAATSSAENAAYTQFAGQTVYLERRPKVSLDSIVDRTVTKLSETYKKIIAGVTPDLWKKYKEWAAQVTAQSKSNELLVPTQNQETPVSPFITNPIAVSQSGIYGADKYVFPDLPPYYEYRAHAFSSAGRVKSTPATSAWVQPIVESEAWPPADAKQEEEHTAESGSETAKPSFPRQYPKAVYIETDNKKRPLRRNIQYTESETEDESAIERKLSLSFNLCMLRDLLPENLRHLWDDADMSINFNTEVDPVLIPFGCLPDLELEYQIFIRTNALDLHAPVFEPFINFRAVRGLSSSPPGFLLEFKGMATTTDVIPERAQLKSEETGEMSLNASLKFSSESRYVPLISGFKEYLAHHDKLKTESLNPCFALRLNRHGALSALDYFDFSDLHSNDNN